MMAAVCDWPRCPAGARFRLTLVTGSLEACGHHAVEMGDTLDGKPVVLEDMLTGAVETFGPQVVPVGVPA